MALRALLSPDRLKDEADPIHAFVWGNTLPAAVRQGAFEGSEEGVRVRHLISFGCNLEDELAVLVADKENPDVNRIETLQAQLAGINNFLNKAGIVAMAETVAMPQAQSQAEEAPDLALVS